MSDEEPQIQPYLAGEMLRQAEASVKSRFDGLLKTKDRASSLLGWSLTTASAALMLCVREFSCQNIAFAAAAATLAAGMTAACILCVLVLKGVEMEPSWIYPVELENMCAERGVENESQMQVVIADEIANRSHRNLFIHCKKQKLLKLVWLTVMVAPPTSLFAWVLVRFVLPEIQWH